MSKSPRKAKSLKKSPLQKALGLLGHCQMAEMGPAERNAMKNHLMMIDTSWIKDVINKLEAGKTLDAEEQARLYLKAVSTPIVVCKGVTKIILDKKPIVEKLEAFGGAQMAIYEYNLEILGVIDSDIVLATIRKQDLKHPVILIEARPGNGCIYFRFLGPIKYKAAVEMSWEVERKMGYETPGAFIIEGFVTNAVTKVGLSGSVWVYKDSQLIRGPVPSDGCNNGYYNVSVDGGTYKVKATAPGYQGSPLVGVQGDDQGWKWGNPPTTPGPPLNFALIPV